MVKCETQQWPISELGPTGYFAPAARGPSGEGRYIPMILLILSNCFSKIKIHCPNIFKAFGVHQFSTLEPLNPKPLNGH
jgi:hypothetical protein